MKKVVLIPDSFKGTLSSAQICRIVAEELHAVLPAVEVVPIPVADGGEGTLEAVFIDSDGVESGKEIIKFN